MSLIMMSCAVDGLTVTGVTFRRETPPGYDAPWVEVAIELESERRFAEKLRSPDQRVGVDFSAAWRSGGNREPLYLFFQSSAALVSLPVDKAVVVYFYLPPEIVARNRLRPEPYAWRVQLAVGGQDLEPQPAWISETLRDPAMAESFATRLAREGPTNAGILQPIYLTPFFAPNAGKTHRLPTFLRPVVQPKAPS